MKRQFRSILLFASALAVLGLGGAGRAEELADTRSIILFGANWCAPCRAELKDLAQLVRAAVPSQVVLAWLDGRPPVKERPGVTILSREEAVAMFERIPGRNQGVPFNVIVDGDGKVCAELREPIRTEMVANFKATCPH